MAEKSKKRKKNPKRMIIPIYLLVIVLLIIIIYAFPSISGALSETMTIEYGNLQVSDKITCYLVKNETVYFANENGEAGYYYADGDVVRTGSEILTITPGKAKDTSAYADYDNRVSTIIEGNSLLLNGSSRQDALYKNLNIQYQSTGDTVEAGKLSYYLAELDSLPSKDTGLKLDMSFGKSSNSVDVSQIGVSDSYTVNTTGIISYVLDGYESEFNPYTMTLLDKAKVEQIKSDTYNICTGNAVKGQPLFKIVDNSVWYAVTWISASDLGKYEAGKSITLKLPERDVTGTVDSLVDEGENIMVVLKFTSYYENLASVRKASAELVTSDCSGLLIENSFINSEDGQTGVYVVGVAGDTTFTPVNIKGSYDGYSIVSAGSYYTADEEGNSVQVSTVQVYDEIQKKQ